MLVEEESIQIQEQESKSFENLMFTKPGSSYLKLMQYYHDEKQLNSQTCNLKTWEAFIENHFSTTVQMEVNIFENQKLFYRIGNIFILVNELVQAIKCIYVYFRTQF